MLFERRIGTAGRERGSCVLCRYGREEVAMLTWRFVGRCSVDEGCSPYIKGLSWKHALQWRTRRECAEEGGARKKRPAVDRERH